MVDISHACKYKVVTTWTFAHQYLPPKACSGSASVRNNVQCLAGLQNLPSSLLVCLWHVTAALPSAHWMPSKGKVTRWLRNADPFLCKKENFRICLPVWGERTDLKAHLGTLPLKVCFSQVWAYHYKIKQKIPMQNKQKGLIGLLMDIFLWCPPSEADWDCIDAYFRVKKIEKQFPNPDIISKPEKEAWQIHASHNLHSLILSFLIPL